jgi:hypothetical protein
MCHAAGDGALDEGQLLYFRQLVVANIGAPREHPQREQLQALLVDARMLPARPHTFALLDDAGIAHNERPPGGWAAPDQAPPPPERALGLLPGEQAAVTVVLDTCEGPFRECALLCLCACSLLLTATGACACSPCLADAACL